MRSISGEASENKSRRPSNDIIRLSINILLHEIAQILIEPKHRVERRRGKKLLLIQRTNKWRQHFLSAFDYLCLRLFFIKRFVFKALEINDWNVIKIILLTFCLISDDRQLKVGRVFEASTSLTNVAEQIFVCMNSTRYANLRKTIFFYDRSEVKKSKLLFSSSELPTFTRSVCLDSNFSSLRSSRISVNKLT